MTDEETKAISDAQVKAFFAPKAPEPKQIFDLKAKKWAKGFLEQPSQYEINKADDYKRCLLRIGRKNSGNTTASNGNTPGNTTASSGKRDIAQLGMQANKSITPL